MAYPVLARQNTPPGSPSPGDRYLVGASPTGAWVGHAHKFAVWRTSAWTFRAPIRGETAFVDADSEFVFFNGSAWVAWAVPVP